jgi:short-subunit dehydrogenase
METMKTELMPIWIPFPADLAERKDVNRLIEFIRSLARPVSALVNNVGIFLPGQIHNEPEGTFEMTMNLNVASIYHLTRGLIGDMMKQRNGHIFMMGSTASVTAYPNGGSYCISKFALLGMAKELREEMKPYGVKVTTLLPGATYTDSWAASGLPESRFMQAADVAEVIWSAYNLSAAAVVEEILLRPQLGDIK